MAQPARTPRIDGGSLMRTIPLQALFAWIGLLALVAVTFLAVLVRSPRSIEALEEGARGTGDGEGAPSASASAVEPERPLLVPAVELDAARKSGAPALELLSQKYPKDPSVLRALLIADAVDRARFGAAIEVIKRLFELSPETAGDDEQRRVFARLASGPPETVQALFDLIAVAPGNAGPDLLFEIVTTDSPVAKPVRDRAQKLLEGVETKKRASAALLVALDLRAAAPCARKPLFARAKESGDARSLPSLKPLVSTTGCKRLFMVYDCNACLGNRSDLNAAITAIEGRGAEKR